MTNTYTTSLFNCKVSEQDAREAEVKFCDALELALGGEAEVVAAYVAYETAFQKHGELPLPAEASDAERAAVTKWEAAEAEATGAAFGDWHGWKTGQMGGAHFEVSIS